MKSMFGLLLLVSVLPGCSSPAEDNTQPQNDVAGAINQPLEKAKGLEQQILDNAAERQKQADEL
ncbi:hypothetical protein [Methylomonas sp. MgM2]